MIKNKIIVPANKLCFLFLYRNKDYIFTTNSNYTLFNKNITNNEININIIKNINKKFYKKYRHTHFYIDTHTIILQKNIIIINTKKDNENNKIEFLCDLITDMILETNLIPKCIELIYKDNIYNINITEKNIIYKNNSVYYIKIPFNNFPIIMNINIELSINVIQYENIYDENILNNVFNILHFRYVYLDTDERERMLNNQNMINDENNIFDIKEKQEFFLENTIETNNGSYIISNCIIWDIFIETDIIPELIQIEFGLIKIDITKTELEFYNNIYNDTITQENNKFLIKIPMFFNCEIILYEDVILYIKTSVLNTKLLYKYKHISFSFITNNILEGKYIPKIIKYFKHKNEEVYKNKISIDSFSFPLKELWFKIPINNDIYLYFPSIGNFEFKKDHLQILNHLFCFGKIVNDYNLISFSLYNNIDFTGERCIINDFGYTINIQNENNIKSCDIYGIGYIIIYYGFNRNNKFTCDYSTYNLFSNKKNVL